MLARPGLPASPVFEAYASRAAFRDRIAVRVRASSDAVFRAVHAVTLADMPAAWALGELRYLPSRLAGHPRRGDSHVPFLSVLATGGSVVLRASRDELVMGSAGRLHQVRDQTPVPFTSGAAFEAFAEPDYEKLYMSLRTAPAGDGTCWLILDHATEALSPAAARKFRRYWRVIKPGGAFVSWQLLRAIRRRAERDRPGTWRRPAVGEGKEVA